MNSGIYKITNVVTGKFYIGSSVNIKKRWHGHRFDLNNNRHDNQHLQRSWNKYGREAFTFQIVEVVIDPEQLIRREQMWIDHTKVIEVGYNMSPVAGRSKGTLGMKFSDETKARMSAAQQGRTLSAEHRDILIECNRNRVWDDEARKKHSEAHKGHKHTPEQIAKRVAKLRGQKRSPEIREKMSIAQKLAKARQREERGK